MVSDRANVIMPYHIVMDGIDEERLGKKKIGMLVYESSVVPEHWVRAVNEHLDLLLVPTTWCRDIMANSGCDPARIAIVPYGADPKRFNPSAPRLKLPGQDEFRFLCVGTPHIRKGHLELVQAFCPLIT